MFATHSNTTLTYLCVISMDDFPYAMHSFGFVRVPLMPFVTGFIPLKLKTNAIWAKIRICTEGKQNV